MLALLLVRSWSSKARPFAVSLTTERCNALPSYVKTAQSGDNRRLGFLRNMWVTLYACAIKDPQS